MTGRRYHLQSPRLSLDWVAECLRDRQARVSGKYVSFRCLEPSHPDRRPSCVAWISDEGKLRVWCYRCESPDTLWRAVAERVGMRTREGFTVAALAPPKQQAKTRRDTVAWARSIWSGAALIPRDEAHPARRWFAQRRLWRPEMPAPPMLRWQEQGSGSSRAGAVVALLAKPQAWVDAYPRLPEPAAVQLISVDQWGKPALDRPFEQGGESKRTLGQARDSALILGDPRINAWAESVRVTEGVADGLAVAARYPDVVVVVGSTAGMRKGQLALWLATAAGRVIIHADVDAARRGRSPAGAAAAGRLRQAVREAGGHCQAVYPPAGFNDAAEAAASLAFDPLDDSWVDYARALAETTDLTRWDIARIAQIATGRSA